MALPLQTGFANGKPPRQSHHEYQTLSRNTIPDLARASNTLPRCCGNIAQRHQEQRHPHPRPLVRLIPLPLFSHLLTTLNSNRYGPNTRDLQLNTPRVETRKPVYVIRNTFNRRAYGRTPPENTQVNIGIYYVIDVLSWTITADTGLRCEICWEDLRAHQNLLRLPCSSRHCFHVHCGARSVSRFGRCPLCREYIVEEI